MPYEWSFARILEHIGNLPLPPYLNREAEEADEVRYNTVYARAEGSVAAPTAGLHFSEEMLVELADSGHNFLPVTLHVGAGTFRPVSGDSIGEHDMHAERIFVDAEAIRYLRSQFGLRPVLAVGTTSLRTLESLYWFGVRCLRGQVLSNDLLVDQWDGFSEGELPDVPTALDAVLKFIEERQLGVLQGRTRLMVAPGYSFRLVDILQTNFHQPGSTLLLLVAAFIGEDWRKVYETALREEFRFLSFGDASLLFRKKSG
jgi:S-adenosylmethionine:tRNA ribosyltransferase-isomerase